MERSLVEQFASIERDHWWFQGRRRLVESAMRHHVGPRRDLLVLDVGAGTGEMTDMLRAFGPVVALEASVDAVAFCRGRFGSDVEVRHGIVPHDLPPTVTADVVAAFDVLEHIADDADAVRALRASLAEGGHLVVTVPAFRLLWGQQDVVSHHHRRYDRETIVRLLDDAGFDVIRATYFNTILFPIVAVVRLARRLPLLNRRPPESDFRMPRWMWVNALLQRTLAAEAVLLRRADLPFGVSILAIVKRRPTTPS